MCRKEEFSTTILDQREQRSRRSRSVLSTAAACVFAWAGALCGLAHAQTPTETTLYNFAYPLKGANPQWPLAQDSVGNLYGTTEYEGAGGAGTVFRLAPDGALSVLHSFEPGHSDGSVPSSGVTFDAAGNLYGTTTSGGSANLGVVYKITPAGEESVLYSFQGGSDGATPNGNLTIDSAGNLYGATMAGGSEAAGTVFKLAASGVESVLYAFTGKDDGNEPNGSLLHEPDGSLVGTTEFGGSKRSGVIFRLSAAGQETVLYTFTGSDQGAFPASGLTQDSSGDFYGTAKSNGGGFGYVFKLDAQNKFSIRYAFQGGADGGDPKSGVILDKDGNLYGAAACCGENNGGVIFKLSPGGQESVLLSFAVDGVRGDEPTGVILGADGRIYGATTYGGAGQEGVLYSLTRAGQEAVLFTFPDSPGGYWPISNLVRDAAGNFYGVNSFGGSQGSGDGAVYRISPSGQESVIYAFGLGRGGAFPSSGVVLDQAGNLYGTTSSGGQYGSGTVYKVTPAGQETVLFGFGAELGATGENVEGGVVFDADGNLYGTAEQGGGGGGLAAGLVFKLDPTGHETILHKFQSGQGDGLAPSGGVIFDPQGNLLGTTSGGGLHEAGTVFKLAPDGQEQILYSFTGGDDGAYPDSGVALDAAGNVYGTTTYGGRHAMGVVYKLIGGFEKVLLDFDGTNGSYPNAIICDAQGNLYGTTFSGGAYGYGVVFEISADGVTTILHNFTGGVDGETPQAGLLLSGQVLYGTAYTGGKFNAGVVFELQ